jgi:hypothetical protein
MNPHLYLNWVVKDEYVSHKCSHVQQELQKFDKHVKAIEERAKWGWSPLYHLLKQLPL